MCHVNGLFPNVNPQHAQEQSQTEDEEEERAKLTNCRKEAKDRTQIVQQLRLVCCACKAYRVTALCDLLPAEEAVRQREGEWGRLRPKVTA